MLFSKRLSADFTNAIRSRGRHYFEYDKVRITGYSDNSVAAIAYGTMEYEVSLDFVDGSTLSVDCDCPSFYSGDNCKHIWATILCVEEASHLSIYGDSNKTIYVVTEEDAFAEQSLDGDISAEYDLEQLDYQDEIRARKLSTKGKPWRNLLDQLFHSKPGKMIDPYVAEQQIVYFVDVIRTTTTGTMLISVGMQEKKKNGDWGVIRSLKTDYMFNGALPTKQDSTIVGILMGAQLEKHRTQYPFSLSHGTSDMDYLVPRDMQEKILRLVTDTGRGRIKKNRNAKDFPVLSWDNEGSWEFGMQLARIDKPKKMFSLTGRFTRNKQQLSIGEPQLLVSGGLLFINNTVTTLNDHDVFDWVTLLRKQGSIEIQEDQLTEFVEAIYETRLPPLELPESVKFDDVITEPRKRMSIFLPKYSNVHSPVLCAEILFQYEDQIIPACHPNEKIVDTKEKLLFHRNIEAERNAFRELAQLGFKEPAGVAYDERDKLYLTLTRKKLNSVVPELLKNNWQVEAEGKRYRQAVSSRVNITSGIDWFEVRGKFDFGGQSIDFPKLLAAIKRGENSVILDDGTIGVLPEQWLQKYNRLMGLGEIKQDHVSFTRHQAGLLDVLLAGQSDVDIDETFAKFRNKIRNFAGVKPMTAPEGFVGTLRDYQEEGLGWLVFLQELGFGGILADDMGLGKTIQVLALLQRVKREGSVAPRASIIVVPRSLVFNWMQEAEKFTPELRVLLFTGAERDKPGEHFNDYDIVLTTYGLLRRDIPEFQGVKFNYAILDEAQAIKNASSQSSKAVRLLEAEHRLTVTGTPVENHIGDLWSQFEFLNPGMLGKLSTYKAIQDSSSDDATSRSILAKAIRPFVLRRTKDQVAKDLPQKTEQTIYCEMKPKQQRHYDELKKHYQASLLKTTREKGLGKSKIQILEALLRLRQVACHPGLLDKHQIDAPSAKLDCLWETLREVLEEGHKALVFSQFTSFLAILRKQLDREKISYLYLDGKTKDRQQVVESFQNDDKYPLFLISLKAGGVGLNLTAADYVFLMDPWWNPAVEAQAIDRVHRIGQTRNVFAYRMICRGTVEEKILQLQSKKRELAESIINADNSLIKKLGQEDLEFLLS